MHDVVERLVSEYLGRLSLRGLRRLAQGAFDLAKLRADSRVVDPLLRLDNAAALIDAPVLDDFDALDAVDDLQQGGAVLAQQVDIERVLREAA